MFFSYFLILSRRATSVPANYSLAKVLKIYKYFCISAAFFSQMYIKDVHKGQEQEFYEHFDKPCTFKAP